MKKQNQEQRVQDMKKHIKKMIDNCYDEWLLIRIESIISSVCEPKREGKEADE